jgi:hypothetical protein
MAYQANRENQTRFQGEGGLYVIGKGFSPFKPSHLKAYQEQYPR